MSGWICDECGWLIESNDGQSNQHAAFCSLHPSNEVGLPKSKAHKLAVCFEQTMNGEASLDISTADVVHDILSDVRDSFRLAMRTAGVPPAIVAEVDSTVGDYILNNYGDL